MTVAEEHIIAFVDLLGFRERISQKGEKADEEPKQILSLLTDFMALRGEAELNTKENSLSFRPAISAFSDHIVISYPAEQIEDIKENGSIALLINLQKVVGLLASLALEKGFLIRGAVTSGKLYHGNSIVFGAALIEAYDLERKVAIYPRVIFSNKAMALFPGLKSNSNQFLWQDFDGVYHLNYLTTGIMQFTMIRQYQTNGKLNIEKQETAQEISHNLIEHIKKITKENITLYNTRDDLNKLAKWNWFLNYLNSSSPLIQHLFGES